MINIQKEQFKQLKYHGHTYVVSSYGRVFKEGKELNIRYNADGYPVVSVIRNGKWSSVAVHIFVALAFIPKPDDGKVYEVNHKDYNRTNNHVENLEWMTHADNVRYSVCNKPDMTGKNNPNYGNRKLSKRYATDPEYSKLKQGRPGLQNGRCQPIELYKNNEYVQTFPYMKECIKYIKQELNLNSNIESIRGNINDCYRNNKKYKKVYSFVKL